MKNINKNSGYSIIVVLLIIGFLLVSSTGIFNLILKELQDNRSMGNYMKAYAGAESAQELALLQIKKYGYAYYDKIEHNINDERSILLSNNPLNKSSFRNNVDVLISYEIGSKVKEYNGILNPLGYDIIPLFYIDYTGEKKVKDINLSIPSGTKNDLSWNIIGENKGISGFGDITGSSTTGFMKTLNSVNGFELIDDKIINDFLDNIDGNYLVLLNSGDTDNIEYNLKSDSPTEYFSAPKTDIISSAEIGNYKQNLSTNLDNTEFLNMIKYSIYSN